MCNSCPAEYGIRTAGLLSPALPCCTGLLCAVSIASRLFVGHAVALNLFTRRLIPARGIHPVTQLPAISGEWPLARCSMARLVSRVAVQHTSQKTYVVQQAGCLHTRVTCTTAVCCHMHHGGLLPANLQAPGDISRNYSTQLQKK